MTNWKIYYDVRTPDGYVSYSNEDGSWKKAYPHGVICVAVRDPNEVWGRWIVSGYSPVTKERGDPNSLLPVEIYVKYPSSEEPFATNILEPFKDKMNNHYKIENITPYIKYGRNASQELWQSVMEIAVKDPDFPKGTPRRRATDGL